MEERAEEIIQNAAERKGKKNIRKNLRGMEDVTKRLTICLIRTPEGRFKENGKQAILEEIRATF